MSFDLVRAGFRSYFGSEATTLSRSPGRANIIGDHTDYNDGFVFPVAVDRYLYIAARPTDGPTRLFSEEAGEGQSFQVESVQVGEVDGWSKYAAGVAWALRERGVRLPNLEIYVCSEIPMGSGLASSAALGVSCALIWNELAGAGIGREPMAHIVRYAENHYVGVNCGVMDQMSCLLGKRELAMYLDTRTLEKTVAPLPSRVSIVLCDTSKPRALAGSQFNDIIENCGRICQMLGVPKLRDASLALLEAGRPKLSKESFEFARHVITENERCETIRTALQNNDLALVGRTMFASHESLRDDAKVSCPELDAMADAAMNSVGCFGARMTGAGFGGACVALVETSQVEAFCDQTLAAYHRATGLTGNVMVCLAVDGAEVQALEPAER